MEENIELKKLACSKQRAKSKGNLKEMAAICRQIGELHYKLGHFEDAITEHLTELQLFESMEQWLEVAVAHRRIGECLSELGNHEKALEHEKHYLNFATKCDNMLEQQRAYATIGRIHLQHAQQKPDHWDLLLTKAETAFRQSLDLVDRLSNNMLELEIAEMKARLLMNLGLICDVRNDARGCSDYFRVAIQISERHHLYEDMFRCQYNLSAIYQKLGNISQALRFSDMAVSCASLRLKDKLAEKDGLDLKIRLLLQLGDFNAAKKSLKKILKMKLSLDESDAGLLKVRLRNVSKMIQLKGLLENDCDNDQTSLMELYEKIGDLATKLDCHEYGLEFYLKMESCATQLGLEDSAFIPIYVSIAETYNDLGQFRMAINYFQKEIRCRKDDHEQICRTWLTIANIQEQNKEEFCQIKMSLEAALQNAQKTKSWKLQTSVLLTMKDLKIKYNDKNGEQSTENELKKLCGEYKLSFDDLSQQLSDDEAQEPFDCDDGATEENFSLETDSSSGSEEENFSRKPLPMKLNEKGETPLHRACITGNLAKVKVLVEQGHPINPRDFCGWLPLHEAANYGFFEIVEYLIDRGARIDDRGGEKCGGITPLHDACSCGNLRVIKLLVDKGATLDVKDDEGNTPLDSLVSYHKRSNGILTVNELSDIKTMERLLEVKMRGIQLELVDKSTAPKQLLPLDPLQEPALVPEDEFVGDDWLVDDALYQRQNAVSFHRGFQHFSQSLRKHKRRNTLEQNECMSKKAKKLIIIKSSPEPVDDVNSIVIGEHTKEELDLLSIVSNSDDSICTERFSESLPSIFPQPHEDETRGFLCRISGNMFYIKIHVENKLILVPICQRDEARTILWLAEEASSHFFQLHGLKPLLSLSLQDGTKLEPTSLVSALPFNCKELLGSVEQWNLPSLLTRYEHFCLQRHCTVFDNIKFRLQCFEETCSVDLSELNLCQQHFIPVSKALQYLIPLKELHLCGNKLEDEGISHLWEVIDTLPNLTHLDISVNRLTVLSLDNLANTLVRSKDNGIQLLQGLKTFDLSYNSFGDASAVSVARCISSLPDLVSLCISSCCLTYRFFEHGQKYLADACQGSNLRIFNIGNNMIGSTGVELLLRSLDMSKLESLDLSNTVVFSQDCQLLKHLNDYLTVDKSFLKELKLDCCHLKPHNISDLCRVVSGCHGLHSLTVSSNPLLTNSDFEQLMASTVNNQLKTLFFEYCSLSSPLDSALLNIMSLKMCSEFPFEKVVFSCRDLDDLDKDNLLQIWLCQWSTRAICVFNMDYVSLFVSDIA